jgi:hypothetical protein
MTSSCRPRAVPLALAAVLATAWALCPARGQPAGGDGVYYSQMLVFRIPFHTDAGDRRIREVQLYASEDQGKTWQAVASARPGEKDFSFTAKREGWYWFAVRTVDQDNQGYPATMDGVPPRLKVCVDTQPPVVTLREVKSPTAAAAVEWDVRDDNLDTDSMRLEYRVAGTTEWRPLGLQKEKTGQTSWNPGTNAPLEVRLSVRDLARNPGEAVIPLTPSAPPKSDKPPPPDPAAAGVPGLRLVNSKRISIDYEIKDVGKSGIAVVELWYTRSDGRAWQKYDERTNPQPPYVFEVSDEGLYGFTLVARTRAGGGQQPPRVGDQPQIWVEVDLTRPVVRLLGVDVGKGQDTGSLIITYSATDKNLVRQSMQFSYAENPAGPWTVIATGEDYSGRYVWKMPPEVPYQFHVKVEASDRAGNVGEAETTKPIVVDLSQPSVQIRGVQPATK